jgi:hypothetical protein
VGFSPLDGSWRVGAARVATVGAVTTGAVIVGAGAGSGSGGACGALRVGNRFSSSRMWSRVFYCTLACSLASESLDSSRETRSSGSESIGNFSGSLEFHLEEEGVLGAVYIGEDELSESLCSIPYLAIVVDAQKSQSSEGESILL